jgi:hypothetical protein
MRTTHQEYRGEVGCDCCQTAHAPTLADGATPEDWQSILAPIPRAKITDPHATFRVDVCPACIASMTLDPPGASVAP